MNKNSIYSKDFILIALGQIISIFGNQILRYALPLYLLKQTGSASVFGTISAFSFIPMLLLFPVGGIIADRLNKKNIMVILDLSTALLVFLFQLLSNQVSIVPMIAVTMILLYSIQSIYQPAVKASIPILVGSDDVLQANSIVDVIDSLASMIGPVIGGILYSSFGLKPILSISIISFLLSGIMELFIHLPFNKQYTDENIFVIGWNDFKDSLDFIFNKQPIIKHVTLIYASVNLLLTALVLISGPVLITQHLNLGTDLAERLYGYSQGGIAGGAILGGLLASFFSDRLSAKISPYLLLGSGLSILLSGIGIQIFNNPLMIYIIITLGFSMLMVFSTLFQVQLMSYIQILTPKNLIGKVISTVICINMSASPIGQFIYGQVFEYLDTYLYLPFYVAALITILISIFTQATFEKVELKMSVK